jgi:hypothetical protein
MLVESTVHWATSTFLKKQQRVGLKGVMRWISKDGKLYYEWDSLHGEIEVFNLRGKHTGVLKADGSRSEKKLTKGRTIDV